MDETRRQRINKRLNAPETEEASRLELETEIFAMASVGGDGNIQAACDRLQALSDEDRRHFRVALNRLDGMLDALALDRHLQRR